MTSAEYQAYLAKPKGGHGRPQPGGGRRGPNKTEAAFLAHLRAQHEVKWAEFEPLNFRLADRCHYRPDVVAMWSADELDALIRSCWQIICYDVKARRKDGKPLVTDDALVKIKMAARLYPWCRWAIVWPDENGRIEYRWFRGGG